MPILRNAADINTASMKLSLLQLAIYPDRSCVGWASILDYSVLLCLEYSVSGAYLLIL